MYVARPEPTFDEEQNYDCPIMSVAKFNKNPAQSYVPSLKAVANRIEAAISKHPYRNREGEGDTDLSGGSGLGWDPNCFIGDFCSSLIDAKQDYRGAYLSS